MPMPMYFARWKDGSFSLVYADDEDEAYELLDEFGDEPAELSTLNSCMVDFELTDHGGFRLREFGERTQQQIVDRGYPLLKASLADPTVYDYDPTNESENIPKGIADAVAAEKERLATFKPREAETELGKDVAGHTNTSGRNADAIIRRRVAERLAKLPIDPKRKPQ